MTRKTNRRNFLAGGLAAVTAISCKAVSSNSAQTVSNKTIDLDKVSKLMPERILGKTNVSLPLLGLGGAGQTPLSKRGRDNEAIALVEKALELGIRYFDTAESYGQSEYQLGLILPAYRDRIYLNSKTDARDYDGAWRHLEKSLKLLKTDYLDSWQLHHVSFNEELDQIFGNNGAIKAVEQAKEQGLIKFSGITGHHEPDIIAEALRRYDFDTTLISLNAADVHHPRPFAKTVLPVAKEKNVGVIAMKVPAYGRLLKPNVLNGNMRQAMGYSLSVAGVHNCIIAAEDPKQLAENVQVAQNYQLLAAEEMKQIESLTANAGEDGDFFRSWT